MRPYVRTVIKSAVALGFAATMAMRAAVPAKAFYVNASGLRVDRSSSTLLRLLRLWRRMGHVERLSAELDHPGRRLQAVSFYGP
jgi:hypothetical protein